MRSSPPYLFTFQVRDSPIIIRTRETCISDAYFDLMQVVSFKFIDFLSNIVCTKWGYRLADLHLIK